MLDKDTLYKNIKDTLTSLINAKKTRTVEIWHYKTDGNGALVRDYKEERKELPNEGDALAAVVDSIAEAVAQEVIAHIKTNLQLTSGAATFTGQSAAGTWIGAGGGVYGPVTINAGNGIAGSETLTIPPGKFQ